MQTKSQINALGPVGTTHAAMENPYERFTFETKIFQLGQGYFYWSRHSEDVYFKIFMDTGLEASLRVQSLKREFKIDDDSPDGDALKRVELALRYVKQIAPGDQIPREIVDGSASWTIEDAHLARAKSRLSVLLGHMAVPSVANVEGRVDFSELIERSEVRRAIQHGFSEAAHVLGYTENGKEKVIQQVERLAGELAYIEALRDYFLGIFRLDKDVKVLATSLNEDKIAREEIWRVTELIKRPLANYRQQFVRVDAQTGEILSVLKNIELVIEFVRDARDDLHRETMLWDEILDQWSEPPTQNKRKEYNKLRNLYQFLAQNFLDYPDY